MQTSQQIFAEALAELVQDAVRDAVREALEGALPEAPAAPTNGTYSAVEAAEILGTTRQAIYTFIKEEGLPALMCQGKWRIPIHRFEEWMAKQTKAG